MTSSIKGACVGFLNKGWEFVSSVPSSVKGLSVYSTFVGVTSAIASNLLYQRSCEIPEPNCTTTPASGHLWWHVPEKTECDTPQEACIESSVPYSLIVPAVSLVPFALRLAAYSIGKMRSFCVVDQRLARIAFEADYQAQSACRNSVLQKHPNLKGPDLKNKMFEFYLERFFQKNGIDPWPRIFNEHPEMAFLSRNEILKKLENYYSDGEKTKRKEMASRFYEVYFQSTKGKELRRDYEARALASNWSLEGEALKQKALEMYLQSKFSFCAQNLENYFSVSKIHILELLPKDKRNASIEDLDRLVSDFCKEKGIKLLGPKLNSSEEIISDSKEEINSQSDPKKKDIADRLLKAFYLANEKLDKRASVISPIHCFVAQVVNENRSLQGDELNRKVAECYIRERFKQNRKEVDEYLLEAKISVFKLNPELAGVCKGDLNQLLEEFCKVHEIAVPLSSQGELGDQKEE